MSLLTVLGLKAPKSAAVVAPARSGPDPEQQRFNQRYVALDPRVDALVADFNAQKYASSPGPVRNALFKVAEGDKELRAAALVADYAAGNAGIDKIDAGLKAFDAAYDAANDAAKTKYLTALAQAKPLLDAWDQAMQAGTLKDPGPDRFSGAVAQFGQGRALMAEGESASNYLLALRGLTRVQDVPRLLDEGVTSLESEITQHETAAAKQLAAASALGLGTIDGSAVATAVQQARAAAKKIAATLDGVTAVALLPPISTAVEACRAAAAKAFVANAQGKPKAVRAKAIALLKEDPEALRAIADQAGGPELLDRLVSDLDGKAKDADSKLFVKKAISARFGPELGEQDLTTKYLPRLYKALGMVPASHTVGNKMLKEINRKRVRLVPSGEYTDGEGKIDLKTPRTGLIDSLVSFGATVLPEKLKNGKVVAGLGLSQFDILTLHEVGHAVDDMKQFMNGKLGNPSFGGWELVNFEQVVSLVGQGKGFYKDFPTLPRAFLEAYLRAVLQKQKPEAESAVAAALGSATAPWKELAAHPAVDCAEHIRLKDASTGLWEGGDSAARKYAIDGTVYQQAYTDQWVGYSLSARSTKVSDYQFRAEGEWYAEAYSAYFVGKLKSSHPLHALLAADQVAGKSAQRAAR